MESLVTHLVCLLVSYVDSNSNFKTLKCKRGASHHKLIQRQGWRKTTKNKTWKNKRNHIRLMFVLKPHRWSVIMTKLWYLFQICYLLKSRLNYKCVDKMQRTLHFALCIPRWVQNKCIKGVEISNKLTWIVWNTILQNVHMTVGQYFQKWDAQNTDTELTGHLGNCIQLELNTIELVSKVTSLNRHHLREWREAFIQ